MIHSFVCHTTYRTLLRSSSNMEPSNECAPTQIFQHEYYFRLTGNNIGDPDRLMVQAFTYSKNISLSPLESRRHEQERKREILHPSHLVSAGEPTNNFAFTSRYRVSENTQKGLPPLHFGARHKGIHFENAHRTVPQYGFRFLNNFAE
jgi:hypothetical protein